MARRLAPLARWSANFCSSEISSSSRTASASEILTSALQDNARATVVGGDEKGRTFGKAVIQNVAPLDDGSAVVVTTARYQTPKRTDINGRGIQVDVAKACPLPTAAEECI